MKNIVKIAVAFAVLAILGTGILWATQSERIPDGLGGDFGCQATRYSCG